MLRSRNELLLVNLLSAVLIGLIASAEAGLPPALSAVRLFLAVAFVLFFPGYAMQAALFPRADDDLDGVERIALSFGLSIATVPALALLLDRLPWGLRLWPILTGEALVILTCSLVASIRRFALPQAEHFLLQIRLDPRGWWREQDRSNRLIYGLLVAALLVVCLSAAAILFLPKPGQHFTEFYMLGPEGLAENYPRQGVVDQPLTAIVGITNRESIPAECRVEVVAAGCLVGGTDPVWLDSGATHETLIVFTPNRAGEDVEVLFLLYRDGLGVPYRTLRLWLQVDGPATAIDRAPGKRCLREDNVDG